jgi:hypothetical protein
MQEEGTDRITPATAKAEPALLAMLRRSFPLIDGISQDKFHRVPTRYAGPRYSISTIGLTGG